LKATLRVSTGAKLVVWRDGDTYHTRLADTIAEAQICLAIDLFEVIADLSGLDLEVRAQATEAVALAEGAQRRLGASNNGEQLNGRPSGESSCL
jgi:hypothetical protein